MLSKVVTALLLAGHGVLGLPGSDVFKPVDKQVQYEAQCGVQIVTVCVGGVCPAGVVYEDKKSFDENAYIASLNAAFTSLVVHGPAKSSVCPFFATGIVTGTATGTATSTATGLAVTRSVTRSSTTISTATPSTTSAASTATSWPSNKPFVFKIARVDADTNDAGVSPIVEKMTITATGDAAGDVTIDYPYNDDGDFLWTLAATTDSSGITSQTLMINAANQVVFNDTLKVLSLFKGVVASYLGFPDSQLSDASTPVQVTSKTDGNLRFELPDGTKLKVVIAKVADQTVSPLRIVNADVDTSSWAYDLKMTPVFGSSPSATSSTTSQSTSSVSSESTNTDTDASTVSTSTSTSTDSTSSSATSSTESTSSDSSTTTDSSSTTTDSSSTTTDSSSTTTDTSSSSSSSTSSTSSSTVAGTKPTALPIIIYTELKSVSTTPYLTGIEAGQQAYAILSDTAVPLVYDLSQRMIKYFSPVVADDVPLSYREGSAIVWFKSPAVVDDEMKALQCDIAAGTFEVICYEGSSESRKYFALDVTVDYGYSTAYLTDTYHDPNSGYETLADGVTLVVKPFAFKILAYDTTTSSPTAYAVVSSDVLNAKKRALPTLDLEPGFPTVASSDGTTPDYGSTFFIDPDPNTPYALRYKDNDEYVGITHPSDPALPNDSYFYLDGPGATTDTDMLRCDVGMQMMLECWDGNNDRVYFGLTDDVVPSLQYSSTPNTLVSGDSGNGLMMYVLLYPTL